MKGLLVFVLGMILGSTFSVVTMCCLQIDKSLEYERKNNKK